MFGKKNFFLLPEYYENSKEKIKQNPNIEDHSGNKKKSKCNKGIWKKSENITKLL